MKITVLLCWVCLTLGRAPLTLQLQTAQLTQTWKVTECSKVQLTDGFDFDDSKQRTSLLNATGRCMSKEDSDISNLLLDEDKKIIVHSYPAVSEFYTSRNYSKGDIAKIIVLAWTQFRSKNPSKQMSGSTFVQLSTSYGQLTIKSDPAGATISVDARPWDEPTNRVDWTESGERSVKLTKSGCQAVEGKVSVPPGGRAIFERKLSCH